MPMEKLQVGDVVIELTNVFPSDRQMAVKNVFSHLAGSAYHAMIYHEIGGVPFLVHSSVGSRQEGVKRMSFLKYLGGSHQNKLFGQYVVLRLRDRNIAAKMADASLRWAPELSLEQAHARPRDSETDRALLPTPYYMRMEDIGFSALSQTQQDAVTLYRAFRAYRRSKESMVDKRGSLPVLLEAVPLSRQGISCNEFVRFSHRVGLIDTLFPEGLSPELVALLDKIEAEKQGQKIKKMPQMKSFDQLETLREMLQKFLAPEIFQQLCLPIKAHDVHDFVRTALEEPTHWGFQGFLFFLQGSLYTVTYEEYFERQKKRSGYQSIIFEPSMVEMSGGPRIFRQSGRERIVQQDERPEQSAAAVAVRQGKSAQVKEQHINFSDSNEVHGRFGKR